MGVGTGLPTGGTAGQVLRKNSSTDYDASFAAPAVASVFGRTGAVVAAPNDYAVSDLNDVAWTPYVPTVTAGSGAFTSVASAGRWKRIGKTVFVVASIAIAPVGNGTAAGNINVSLPVTVNSVGSFNYYGSGREITTTGVEVQAWAPPGASWMTWAKYDNTYPGGDGRTIQASITYEAA
jgi:hypothetical protein